MITTEQAAVALRLACNALAGAQELGAQWKEDPNLVAITSLALMQSLTVLDFFLIRRRENTPLVQQYNRVLQVCKFLSGSQESNYTLSDGKTCLLLRWPTAESQPITLKSTSKPVLNRWDKVVSETLRGA